MHVYTKEEAFANKTKLIEEISKGAVFIYPTDTIYGLGCDATNDHSVRRIRELKGRYIKPLSIIAPSLSWIKENCELSDKAKAWLLKLPGPYTLIVLLKNPSAICVQTNRGLKTLGVRFPDHWIFELVASIKKPIITTSVNVSGKHPATNQEQLERFDVNFIIYEGEKPGKPSTVVDLTKDERIMER